MSMYTVISCVRNTHIPKTASTLEYAEHILSSIYLEYMNRNIVNKVEIFRAFLFNNEKKKKIGNWRKYSASNNLTETSNGGVSCAVAHFRIETTWMCLFQTADDQHTIGSIPILTIQQHVCIGQHKIYAFYHLIEEMKRWDYWSHWLGVMWKLKISQF